MVSHSGAPGGNHRIRPLNQPRPAQVAIDTEGRPLTVSIDGHEPRLVIDLLKSWRVDDEWWREDPVSRIYWQCVLEDGQFLSIYQDLHDGHWWRQRA